MSAAGQFIATCRKRGVAVVTVGDEVSLRGCKSDVDALLPRLTECVDAVYALVLSFQCAIPPRLAEWH